ncbi:hypothetical protein WA026_006589 [Henosepilachna vigintioctopunctata]|uniref:Uncharacterized protein n=1 Tax=Henosepilachna vigintioctopunctata TaxID=420089 RepID=A0AAW1U796_9CUCU
MVYVGTFRNSGNKREAVTMPTANALISRIDGDMGAKQMPLSYRLSSHRVREMPAEHPEGRKGICVRRRGTFCWIETGRSWTREARWKVKPLPFPYHCGVLSVAY